MATHIRHILVAIGELQHAPRKELRKAAPADYGAPTALTKISGEAIQVKARLNKVLSGDPMETSKDLIGLLRNEAKVI